MRLMLRSRVVFPQPDGPTKTVVVCEGMIREKSATARVPSANALPTERNSIMELLTINAVSRSCWAGTPQVLYRRTDADDGDLSVRVSILIETSMMHTLTS